MKIGMLTDFPAVEYCNGPALASQAFRRNMEGRGHTVRFIGPKPHAGQRQVDGDGNILFPSLRLRRYANTPFGFPWPLKAFTRKPDLDVIHGNSNAQMMHYGLMMRSMHNIPCLQTNTIYLPAFKHHMVPEEILAAPGAERFFDFLGDYVEKNFSEIYGAGDGLIVQCKGLVDYWQKMGLNIPLHIIPRPVDVRSFDRPLGPDPYRADFKKGKRLFVACRHAAEKSLDQLLRIFAHHVAPTDSEASLTLVGDGPAHIGLKEYAAELGIENRVQFVGEIPHKDLPVWYKYADVFAYPSVSETFGQVISEALWMGCPVVGMDDKMGMAYQVEDGVNGLLVDPAQDGEAHFGAGVIRLLSDDKLRRKLGAEAARRQRVLCHPDNVYAAYEKAYEEAVVHRRENPSNYADLNKAQRFAKMIANHAFPWTWQTLTLVGVGALPGKGRFEGDYKPRKDVLFDAAPAVQHPANPSHLRVVAGQGGPGSPVRAPFKSRVAR